MFLRSVRLYHFRNIPEASIAFSSGLNLVVGNNGQGKTNLLEAISLLAGARSFRTSKLSECILFGKKEASVFGKVVTKDDEHDLGVLFQPDGKKQFLCDGKPIQKMSETIGKFSCVSFSPDDLEIVKGGPLLRRKIIDRYQSEISAKYFHALMQYQRALQSKNILLKSGTAEKNEIRPWNEVLAENAYILLEEREQFVQRLREHAAHIYKQFGSRDGELRLNYERNIKQGADDKEKILAQFEEFFDKERHFRKSLIGPQRDDIQISLSEKSARNFASQGQTREWN
jgi:DNA replication and repair protein RecF